MSKILFSRTRLDSYETNREKEFNECISDLLELKDVKRLDEFSQHCNTSRLQHSVNVAYYSYLFSRFLGYNYRSSARAGLLHDLFLYDWRSEKMEQSHAFAHPKVALETARKNTDLTAMEEDAIAKHMWPLCKSRPRYMESLVVCIADKYCCTCEVLTAGARKVRGKAKRIANLFAA